MRTTFAVLGDGSWGTAIALLLARREDHRVRLWSARRESGASLREHRENRKFLPGVPLPDGLELTTSVAEAVEGADVWVSAIPTVYLRPTLERVRRERESDAPVPLVVSLTKGMENTTFRRPSDVIRETLGDTDVVVLSGPSHAEEVCKGLPTSVVVAGHDPATTVRVQQAFHTDRFRVYTNQDPVGVELGGALKNVISIAAGACAGLGYGDNALSALICRGLAEMTRFGVALGAEASTFAGLAGLGDLITSCISRHGRNRSVGYRLGTGESLHDIQAGMTMVAEGVTTARAVFERASQMGIDMPITSTVYRAIYEGLPPQAAVDNLMLRSLKGERWPG